MKFAQFEKIIGKILPYNTYNISQIPTCLSLGMTAVVFNLFFNISNYWSLFQLTINLHLTCPLMQKIRYTKLLSNATQICTAPKKR